MYKLKSDELILRKVTHLKLLQGVCSKSRKLNSFSQTLKNVWVLLYSEVSLEIMSNMHEGTLVQ